MITFKSAMARALSGAATRNVATAPPRNSPSRLSREGSERALAAKSRAADDRVLVRRFNEGDESAFVEIVRIYRERIRGIVGGFLRNEADAEEVAQDTFVRAHRGLGRFRGDSSLATWLHRIAVNLARNRYWYFYRRGRHLTLSLDCPAGPESTATLGDHVDSLVPPPNRNATVAEFVELVAVCMQRLDASHREILVLRNELHRSYDDIARSLGINEGTVKSRIARARGQLRHLMTEACPEFAGQPTETVWFEPSRGAEMP